MSEAIRGDELKDQEILEEVSSIRENLINFEYVVFNEFRNYSLDTTYRIQSCLYEIEASVAKIKSKLVDIERMRVAQSTALVGKKRRRSR
jgi:hypothetical protein